MKRVGIIGLGRAGFSSAYLLGKLGYRVFISDKKLFSESFKRTLSKNFLLEEGINSERILMNDLVIVSPGVSERERIISRIKEKSIPFIDEIELGYRFIEGKIIAVTGTNGKSTVAKWIYECIKDKNTFLAGNIGIPLTGLAFKKGVFVIEVSSFQLKRIKFFRPHIGMILNIDRDHMDWHTSFEDYLHSKLNIFRNQKKPDFLILDEDVVLPENIKPESKILKVSLTREVEGIFLKDKRVIFNINGNIEEWEVRFPLKGKFNIKNGLFVLLSLKILGKNLEEIKEKFESFRGLPHRLEYLGEKEGIEVYNDSKSTNPHSVRSAIESIEKPIILIMGGLNKGLSFKELKGIIRQKCKGVVLFGKSRNEILADIEDKNFNIEMVNSIKEALEKAFKIAKKGDIIIFSPGCASFDMYKNYAERGEDFKNAFNEL